jgi:hypothetical protein
MGRDLPGNVGGMAPALYSMDQSPIAMRNMPSLLSRILVASISLTCSITLWGQNECAYSLKLLDSGGDGWGGSQLAVIQGVVGSLDTTYYELTTGYEQEFVIEATIGDAIILLYLGTGPDQ